MRYIMEAIKDSANDNPPPIECKNLEDLLMFVPLDLQQQASIHIEVQGSYDFNIVGGTARISQS